MQDYKKIVWAYMLENGRETTGEWSYYGSDWESIPGRNWTVDYHAQLLQKVRSVGVDWDKTVEPSSSVESCFDGSFVPSSRAETLLGTLILNDGSEYTIGCRDDDGMGKYIETFMRYLKDSTRVSSVFGE